MRMREGATCPWFCAGDGGSGRVFRRGRKCGGVGRAVLVSFGHWGLVLDRFWCSVTLDIPPFVARACDRLFSRAGGPDEGIRTPTISALQHPHLAAFPSVGRSRGQDGTFYGSAEYIAGRVLFCVFGAAASWDAPGGDSSNARRGDGERGAGDAVYGPSGARSKRTLR